MSSAVTLATVRITLTSHNNWKVDKREVLMLRAEGWCEDQLLSVYKVV